MVLTSWPSWAHNPRVPLDRDDFCVLPTPGGRTVFVGLNDHLVSGKLRGLAGVLLLFGLSTRGAAAPLADQASQVLDQFRQNSASVQTLDVTLGTVVETLDGKGAVTTSTRQIGEHVRWKRSAAKLRRNRESATPVGYVADGMARTLLSQFGGSTRFEIDVPEEQIASLATPSPAWLWHPEILLPRTPASVTSDGSVITVVTSTGQPRRTLTFDRVTGRLKGFTETDATGRVVRMVTCLAWKSVGGAWVPSALDERIQGTDNGLHRVTTFSWLAINQPMSSSAFLLP